MASELADASDRPSAATVLARLHMLAEFLGYDDVAEKQDPSVAAARQRESLVVQACLLILDDVWDARHVNPFRIVGERGALLVTTAWRGSGISAA
jgi:hypothetical protein